MVAGMAVTTARRMGVHIALSVSRAEPITSAVSAKLNSTAPKRSNSMVSAINT